MTLPDYRGGSIVNLMASIAASYDAPPSAYVPVMDPNLALNQRAGHVVLMVVDGLGYHYLKQATGVSALQQHLRGSLTSVFPSTTATGVTAFLTGVPAQQHGLTGWHIHLDEIGESAAILPMETRAQGKSLLQMGVSLDQLFPYRTFFEQIKVPSHAISPDAIAASPFNRRHTRGAHTESYRSLTQFFENIERATRAQDQRRYIYAYYPDFDSTAHEYGVHGLPTLNVLRRFSDGLERLTRVLAGRGVTVVLTADHGFVDIPAHNRLELQAHPKLEACLSQPLCGERRLPYCYVKPERRTDFESYVRDELGEACDAIPSAQLIDDEYFGLGTAHPKLADRVGDYTLMLEGYTLKDWIPGEHRHTLIGVHGGMSEEEMRVPVVIVKP